MRRLVLPAAIVALLLVVLLLVASALARPAALPAAAGQMRVEQVDPSAYPEITLYVSALDDAGNPQLGLASDDFTLTEDGAPVELSAFGGAGGEAVTSVLVVDRSGSMDDDGKLDGARDAASAFVDLMRPGDQAALIGFSSSSDIETLSDFTSEQEELQAAINRLRPSGGTALYDAVVAGVEQLRAQGGRKLLLVLTDGQDCSVPFDNCPDAEGSRSTLSEAIAYAQAAGQPVAVVGLGAADGINEVVLQQLADETGGRYLYAPQAGELAGLYTDLAAAVQREYRLSYISPRPFYDGTRRDIRVSVGGVEAAGGYTERHLINVVSSPLVGVALLVPLAGLLLLPVALRRRAQGRVPAPLVGSYQPDGAAPILVTSSGPATVPATDPTTIVADVRRCASCATPLRASARFCSRCGAAQE